MAYCTKACPCASFPVTWHSYFFWNSPSFTDIFNSYFTTLKMKLFTIGILFFGAAAIAQSWDDDLIYARAALMNGEDIFEQDTLWTRDADSDFENWMDDILESRDAEADEDNSVTVDILWSRGAKKPAPKDSWVAPKVDLQS